MGADTDELTPMMRQYRRIKATCGDAILMFRLGDFYEMFEDDAKIASDVLDVTLTKKPVGGGKSVPLAGVPYHALNNYLFKLTRAGYRVAICEQTEDPKKTKKLVSREVVRTVTPGTLIEAEAMEGAENNYLVALHDGGLEGVGFALADVSTGEFRATAMRAGGRSAAQDTSEVLSELEKISPSEILIPETLSASSELLAPYLRRGGCVATRIPAEAYRDAEEIGEPEVEEKFDRVESALARKAAGALLGYIQENYKGRTNSLLSLKFYRPAQYLGLDAATARNLELVQNLRDGGKKGTLLSVLDRTKTAMGARELKQWILRPLLDLSEIKKRQDAIAALLAQPTVAQGLGDNLRQVKDIERLLARVNYRTAGPRDLKAMGASLAAFPHLSKNLAVLASGAGNDTEIFAPLDEVPETRDLLERALVDDPPFTSREGGIFTPGYNEELDDLRKVSRGGKDWILELQARERERTGIPSLKIGYNKVFGYYIEITKAHQEKAPAEYIRKQTLVSAERYITPELKEYENKVLTAQDRICEIERELFEELQASLAEAADRIQAVARRLAVLDALLSLATVAGEYGYCRPVVDDSETVGIEAGRHPTLDRSDSVDRFVPNDTLLDNDSNQIVLITGPNMGGKSTYIRQVALLTLMAQMGSYVPAANARIGLVDRIFSRVGASDNLFEGQSTFMVEMSETAYILENATPKSLIILDEIGRGTATYDGIGLAWAIVEYLLKIGRRGAKTLFATHYHEMADLEDRHERVKNQHALVSEQNGKVTFLYQIVAGPSDHSYGIHVAELAGIPKQVTRRAARILSQLESGEFHHRLDGQSAEGVQLSLFNLIDEPLANRLRNLSPEEMSPMEALQALDELVRQAKGEV
jgi:DNA mismatch repair protein MutS